VLDPPGPTNAVFACIDSSDEGRKVTRRLPLILSATALAIAVLGMTSLGQAAGSAIEKAVPLARVAGFAKNAGKLNGHKSSIRPHAGQIPVLGPDGKLPAWLGAVGPAGAKGDPGPQGPAGISGYQRVQQQVTPPSGRDKTNTYTVSCPGGKSVLGGGFEFGQSADTTDLSVYESTPSSNSSWEFKVRNTTGNSGKTVTLSAVCANVGA
jgi:hypothetical protein